MHNPAGILDPENGGRALLGGLIFGWISVEIVKRRLGVVRSTGDLFALALPAGEAVGRLGCYYNGCCYGTPSHLPWSIWQHGAWRHPSQLYSAGSALLLFALLLSVRNKLHREGDLFRLYLVGFGLSRFVIEFFRWQDHYVLGLSVMQWFCLELSIYAVVGWLLTRRRPSPKPILSTEEVRL